MRLEKLSTYISIKEGLSPPLMAGIVLKLETFDHVYFCHYKIVAKNRSRMTTAITFPLKNDTG